MRTNHRILTLAAGLLVATSAAHAQVLPNLQLWLKPEGITNTTDLSKVSFWTNSVGTGNDATNAIVANQPVVLNGGLNGFPVVRFTDDGSNVTGNTNLNWLASSLPLSANSNSFTAIMVVSSQITGSRDTLLQQLGGPGTTILFLETNATPASPALVGFASGQGVTSPYAYPVRDWEIFAIVQDAVAGTQSIYQNGNLLATTNIGTTATLANGGWLIGCNKNRNTHGLNGHLAEVLIYDAALGSGDLTATTYYLAQKFGFVILTDSFDTADTVNFNDNIVARQSGAVAPVGYNWTLGSITGNQVALSVPTGGFQAQSFGPETNLVNLTGKEFKVSYDITSFNNSGNLYDTWAGVAINAINSAVNPPTWPYGFSVIMFTNGGYGVFVDAAGVGGGNPSPEVHPPYHVEITVSGNVATLNIQGTNTLNQSTNIISQYALSCPVGNYVSLSIGGQAATTVTYDNLSITATPKAPEIVPALAVAPTLLLADNFTTADTTNLLDNLATRQSGTTATVPFVTTGIFNAEASIQGNRLVLSNIPPVDAPAIGMASPNLDFRLLEHLSSFRLRCTMNPVGTVNEWAGIRFRDNFPGVFVANGSTPGVGFIIRGDASWTMFLGGSTIAQGVVPVAADYTLDVEVRENVMRATLNGQVLSVGCGDTAYVLPPTQTANYITLQAFANQGVSGYYATFDDLEISSLNTGRVIAAPVLVNPVFTAGATNSFAFDFGSLANVFYAVESKGDLTAPAWTDAGRLYGNGSNMTITNAPVPATPGFYRLRIP